METQELLTREPRDAAPRMPLPNGGHRALRILVADDSADMTLVSAILLESFGFEVKQAFNGAFALEQAARYLPDVALLDLGMPLMNGYQVARALRASKAHGGMKLVAISGYALPADVHRALESGFDHHLAKPADLGQLLAILAATTARR